MTKVKIIPPPSSSDVIQNDYVTLKQHPPTFESPRNTESSLPSSPTNSSVGSPLNPPKSPRRSQQQHHHQQQQQHGSTSRAKSPQPSLAQLVQLSHDVTAGGITPADQQHQPLLVLKLGTSTIMETATANFSLSNLGKFVDCICNIKEQGYQVVIVSSGAVGAGVIHMKLKERPTTLQGKQAASAVGQCRMMRLYEDLFAIREQKVGQLILTRTDLMDRTRFINFKQTLRELLRLGVVPIINENDSIATAQLRFGDNDTLAAYVAVSLGASWLFLMTDVDCLYTANPRLHPEAKPIPYVGHLDDVYKLLDEKENTGTSWGTGGMRTKIVAAKIATATGIHTALCHGKFPERVLDIVAFAEAHGQTPAEWEAELKKWHERSLLDGQAKMKSSRSEASFERERRQLNSAGAMHVSCADFRGLQHHHSSNSPYCHASKAPSTKSADESTELQDSVDDAKSVEDQGTSNHYGLVTVDNLSEMPYLATIFAAQECTQKIKDQRRWILSLPVRGRVHIDDGAARAIIEGKKSLFAAGITKVEGMFYENEAVALVLDRAVSLISAYPSTASLSVAVSEPPMSPQDSLHMMKTEAMSTKTTTTTATMIEATPSGTTTKQIQQQVTNHHLSHSGHHGSHYHKHHARMMEHEPSLLAVLVGPPSKPMEAPENEGELARCLINFSSIELEKIKGMRSNKFREVLGYECDPEVAHRQNIIFVNPCAVYGCSSQSSYCTHLITPLSSSAPQSPHLKPHP